MSEMIELVALSIVNKKRERYDLPPCEWHHLTDEAKVEYGDLARAAIEAMRKPTRAMLDKAKPHMDSWSSNLAWWDKMIDGALSPAAKTEVQA